MKLTCCILLQFLVLGTFAQDSSQYQYLYRVVSFLASDKLQGRACGTEHEKIAADFIALELSKIDRCHIDRQRFSFTHNATTYDSENVIGFIDNESENTIVLSAHFDHLGTGGPLSNSKGSSEVHNGADDNASGVALLLNLAQDLSNEPTDYNYLFLAHSGHELGLYGSKHFLDHLNKKYKELQLFVNFDMVGRRSENKVYYDCSLDCEESFSQRSTEEVQFNRNVKNRINTLDSKWFVEAGIPAVTFSTGQHVDYHKITDDIEYIDFNGIIALEQVLLDWLTADSSLEKITE